MCNIIRNCFAELMSIAFINAMKAPLMIIEIEIIFERLVTNFTNSALSILKIKMLQLHMPPGIILARYLFLTKKTKKGVVWQGLEILLLLDAQATFKIEKLEVPGCKMFISKEKQ